MAIKVKLIKVKLIKLLVKLLILEENYKRHLV